MVWSSGLLIKDLKWIIKDSPGALTNPVCKVVPSVCIPVWVVGWTKSRKVSHTTSKVFRLHRVCTCILFSASPYTPTQ